MATSESECGSDSGDHLSSGIALLRAWQRQARQSFPPAQGRICPGGAEISYYTWLGLLEQGTVAAVPLDDEPLSTAVVTAFQERAARVARHLWRDFGTARRLAAARSREVEAGRSPERLNSLLRRLLAGSPLRQPPELDWLPEHLAGVRHAARRLWHGLWEECWQRAAAEHRAAMRARLDPNLLSVTRVAGASASEATAQRRLRKQLQRDWQERGWGAPPPDVYLYNEPLDEYLLRDALSWRWLQRLCGALAGLTRQLPALIDQRAAELKRRRALARGGSEIWRAEDTEDEPDEDEGFFEEGEPPARSQRQKTGALPSPRQRRPPEKPAGRASAEATFSYAALATKVAPEGSFAAAKSASGHRRLREPGSRTLAPVGRSRACACADSPNPSAIRPGGAGGVPEVGPGSGTPEGARVGLNFSISQPLDPAQARSLLAQAINVTEWLLWDQTLAIRAQPTQSPERLCLLREALLPPQLRRQYQLFRERARRWQRDTGGAALPLFAAWESCLREMLPVIDARLEGSSDPSAITPAKLGEWLEAAPLPLDQQYLYHCPFDSWVRAALPASLPGEALLAFCRALAEQVGPWPAQTPGAPAAPEQAALAIFWNTKLALEHCIGGVIPPSPVALASLPAQPVPGWETGGTGNRVPSTGYAMTWPERCEAGWQGVWLDRPLPPEALELATVIAPLVARVLYQSAREAASQGQALLLARLRAGEQSCWAAIEKSLLKRAYALRRQAPEEAAHEAAARLREQLEHTLLPCEISLELLSLDLFLVENKLDILNRVWHTLNSGCYQFLGSLAGYAGSLIRPDLAPREVALREEWAATEKPGEQQLELALVDDTAILQVLELMLTLSQSRPDETAPGSPDADDARLLARGLLASHTGRSMLILLAGRGVSAALEVERLWLAERSQPAAPFLAFEPPPAPPERLALEMTLARVLMDARVRTAPELRRALGDLFELPMRAGQMRGASHLPLGTLERVAALVPWSARRGEAERVLAALEWLAKGQRRAVCARLLRRAEIQLLLGLLETAGWQRPLWLQATQPEPLAAAERPAPLLLRIQESWPAERAVAAGGTVLAAPAGRYWKGGSPQLMLTGRLNWLKRLGTAATRSGQRARSLTGEWLGTQFWSGVWEQTGQPQVLQVYQATLKALPTRLSLAATATWAVAAPARLAMMPEVLGLTGPLPPQLPAQLDTPEFLREVWQFQQAQIAQIGTALAEAVAATTLHRLRREIQVARGRTHLWFTELASLATADELRIMLAAMSCCASDPERLDRWLKGGLPSARERAALLQEVTRWHRQPAIQAGQIPDLLRSAGAQVLRTWLRLRRPC